MHSIWIGLVVALPLGVAAHEPAPRSAQTEAALAEAASRVPAPRWERLHERRAKSAAGAIRVVEVRDALAQSVVVVLDEDGAPQAACVDGAPADAKR